MSRSATRVILVALVVGAPASPAWAESPVIPCGSGEARPSAPSVPANLPSFLVFDAFSPATLGLDAGVAESITLGREEGMDTVPVAAEVRGEQTGPEARYFVVPDALLREGYVHVLGWEMCWGRFGRGSQRYSVGPPLPLPAAPATLAMRVEAVVIAGVLERYELVVTLEAASSLEIWYGLLDFRADAAAATTTSRAVTGSQARFVFPVSCDGFGGFVAEGLADVRAGVGGFGLAPILEASTTYDVQCEAATFVDDTGRELTAAEIAAVTRRPDAGPRPFDGGTLPFDAGRAGSADAGSPFDGSVGVMHGGSCSAHSSARSADAALGLGLVAVVVSLRRARRSRGRG